MIFYLARHGETQWNRLGLLQGQYDSDLTEVGERQAQQLAESLQGQNIDAIHASTLQRASDTAAICADYLNKPLALSEQLVERHFGELQGKSFAELEQNSKYDGLTAHSIPFEPEGGETASASANRFYHYLLSLVESLTATRVLVVSHGDVIRNFLNTHLLREGSESVPLLNNGGYLVIEYCQGVNGFTAVESR